MCDLLLVSPPLLEEVFQFGGNTAVQSVSTPAEAQSDLEFSILNSTVSQVSDFCPGKGHPRIAVRMGRAHTPLNI